MGAGNRTQSFCKSRKCPKTCEPFLPPALYFFLRQGAQPCFYLCWHDWHVSQAQLTESFLSVIMLQCFDSCSIIKV